MNYLSDYAVFYKHKTLNYKKTDKKSFGRDFANSIRTNLKTRKLCL